MTKKSNSPRSNLSIVKKDKVVIFESSHEFWTTSIDVAEKFGRQHYNVMKTIKNLECSIEFNALNYKGIEYKDSRGRIHKMYNISRDGFAFLAMGFTGKDAALWKEKYISAFNYLIKENERLKKQLERHRRDTAWIAAREENIDRNKDFNAAISDFQKYATESGSLNAKRYFMLFNDMVNHNLFTFPKGMKNIPDKLEKFQLNFRDSTTKVVMDIIHAGIEKSVHYKELFLLCKAKVVEIAKALGVTPVPLIEGGQYELLK